MLRSIATKTLRDYRRALAWWSAGVVGFVALYAVIYPTVRDTPDIQDFADAYPEALRAFIGELDLASAPGYLQAEAFSFLLPLIFLIFGIGAGAGAIAGEEDRGTMELVLAAPLTRRRVVLEKLAALASGILVLALVLLAALWLGARAVDMEVAASKLAAGVVSLVLLSLVFTTLTLLVGAATGSRGLAMGVGASLAVAAYVLNGLGELVDSLDAVQPLSPFYLYAEAEPLRNGLEPLHALALLALALLFAALSPPAFARRDAAL